MFCCFRQARQSPRIFHSTSDIIFSRPSQMIPVTVAQVTAQFLELSACPIPLHHIYMDIHTIPVPLVYTQPPQFHSTCNSYHQYSAIQLATVISLWIPLIWQRNSTVRHWYLQVMALFLWAMPLKHGSSMVRALIHKHMDMGQFDSILPITKVIGLSNTY